MIEISSVLIANRGEIARRVIVACRQLGLATVAVFGDPDAGSPHVAEADRAVRLPGRSAAETYLDQQAVLAAAAAAGADAVHPGYGFLSEDAGFARSVLKAGLTWIGPTPEAIELMGDKVSAKRLMAEAGVPVLAELDPADLAEAELPVLIKASAGGGGRGMRVVHALAELPAELDRARAEAERAFGDGRVFCERYLARGRHLEVQVLADAAGAVWILGERECSVQRRHQKVIEEAPSPLAEQLPELRSRLYEAAGTAARSIGYLGAGTVEFICDTEGNCYFLEMNTRLQVEHPVTEAVTGLDLVQAQLRIAMGRPLTGEPPRLTGHAVEARLYAEDPAAGWQPQTGILHALEFPDEHSTFAVSGLRVDSGVTAGSQVHPYADPMLAKVISHAPDRATAIRQLAGVLRRARVHGPVTNRDQLVRVLQDRAFLDGVADTALLAAAELAAPLVAGDLERRYAAAAALAAAASDRAAGTVLADLPSGWRNVPTTPQRRAVAGHGGRHEIAYWHRRAGIELVDGPEVVAAGPDEVVLSVAGVQSRLRVSRHGDRCWVDGPDGSAAFTLLPRFTDPAAAAPTGSLLAPLPGSVLRLAVAAGDRVRRGQPLLWIEAMKMEHPVAAAEDGVIGELPVGPGSQVAVGDLLAVIVPADGAGAAAEPA
ncbi:MAG TPA: biotin carboxylase N-terminal domain-containing protein [Jatrophihabitans sp.]|nr:biotin carboxylase N-terminal domain-containing protein [Jatrophihabitans sp.]